MKYNKIFGKNNPLLYDVETEIEHIEDRLRFLNNMKKKYLEDKKLSGIQLNGKLQIINIIKTQYSNDLDKLKFLN